ncbi:ScbR family autoregulator-binding transcription factor [Streptomyces sp. 2P-4]|uniref:ScbR family autoregulator-binding transcription factor n=1 Tax=Streptomyces sp. 2P-4 TaxID=2931974 RepID=UPI00253FE2A5|nr:ScbR family autoregulator-binding transcription factor [Streptomyces sp. 2P-4]
MQERSERTRRRLVRAGAEMFHRNGYAQSTLGDIARTAGVTKGALYFHFGSKDELAEAVQQRGAALLGETVHELRAAGASPLQALVTTTHWLARALHDDPAVPASFRITKECTGRPAGTADFHRAWLGAVRTLLRQARDAGELRPGLGWESAESLVAAAACGIEALAAAGMPNDELRSRVAAMWELLLPGLVPGTAAAAYALRPPGEEPAGPPAPVAAQRRPGTAEPLECRR